MLVWRVAARCLRKLGESNIQFRLQIHSSFLFFFFCIHFLFTLQLANICIYMLYICYIYVTLISGVQGSFLSPLLFPSGFFKCYLFKKESLHPTQGLNSCPRDQESHAPLTDPARCPFQVVLITYVIRMINLQNLLFLVKTKK